MESMSITRSASFPVTALCHRFCRQHTGKGHFRPVVPGSARDHGDKLAEVPDQIRDDARQAQSLRRFSEA